MSERPMIVMYVEDDADIRELMEIIFEREADISVLCCPPSLGIVEQIRHVMPDVLMLDVMMPGMDGITIAKHVRADAQLARIPYVFITAKMQPQEQDELWAQCPLAVFAKPFDALAMPGELRALLAKHRAAR